MYRILELSCFLIIWTTRLDYGLTVTASASRYQQEKDWATASYLKNSSNDDNDVREENQNIADATIRNFLPIKVRQRWMKKEFPSFAEMLFFNVSAIGDNEEVTLAQLHLHRRRLAKTHVTYHRRLLPTPYRVNLFQVQPNHRHRVYEDARTMKLASLPVSHMTKGGWHTLDVTPVIRELLINAQGPVELLLGVQFEAPKRLDKTYSPLVPLKHFLKNPNVQTPEHPFKAFSYLVVFSEADPFFEDFEDDDDDNGGDDFQTEMTAAPTPSPDDYLKERHLKHKISKGKTNDVDSNRIDVDNKWSDKKANNKDLWKYKRMENEVYKMDKSDVIRHKNKHKGTEVRRSKADELALEERTKLKSLPFLHANEFEEIRQTSRRLTRSSMGHQKPEKSKRASPDIIKTNTRKVAA